MKIWCLSISIISLKKRANVFRWNGYFRQESFFCQIILFVLLTILVSKAFPSKMTNRRNVLLSWNNLVNFVRFGDWGLFMHRKMCIYAHFSVHECIQTSLIDASAILCWYDFLHFFCSGCICKTWICSYLSGWL